VSIKYVTRKTQIQIGLGEQYAIAEIEVSDKRRPAPATNGLEDGMKRMELDGEKGEDFFEMDWRTAVKLVEAEAAAGNGNEGKIRAGMTEVCPLPSSPGS
jgi:AAA family ATPase